MREYERNGPGTFEFNPKARLDPSQVIDLRPKRSPVPTGLVFKLGNKQDQKDIQQRVDAMRRRNLQRQISNNTVKRSY